VRIADVRLESAERPFLAVNLPIGDPIRITGGSGTETYSRHVAQLSRPEDPFSFTSRGRFDCFTAGFFLEPLEETTRGILGIDERPLSGLRERISLDTVEGRSLWRFLAWLWSEAEQHGSPLETSDLVSREAEGALAALLVHAATSGEEGASLPPNRRAVLRKARDHVDANLKRPLRQADLARAAGVSARTLTRVFRECLGVSPMRYVRRIRLGAVHRDLLAGEPGSTTVTRVAMEYGFFRLGAFAGEYRREFQELPSETLRH
jgi:AraC-like DNA-binding protein